jgi:putative transcriptional regulator
MTSRLDIKLGVKQPCHVKNTVREMRTQLGLSQAELSSAMGVSRQTINSIETGRYLPSLPLAISLARYFQSPVEEVFDVDA